MFLLVRSFFLLIVLAVSVTGCGPSVARQCPFTIVQTFDHDVTAFTQGFLVRDGQVYESTGRLGQSTLRTYPLVAAPTASSSSSTTAKRYPLEATYFAEGLSFWQDPVTHEERLVQLTWRAGKVFVYQEHTTDFVRLRTVDLPTELIPHEGWGLTQIAPAELLISNGSAQLCRMTLTSDALHLSTCLDVTLNGQPIANLNELEAFGDTLYACVWKRNQLLAIDPQSGVTRATFDFSDLAHENMQPDHKGQDVFNGIAYDPVEKRVFITGKLWPHIYEIQSACFH